MVILEQCNTILVVLDKSFCGTSMWRFRTTLIKNEQGWNAVEIGAPIDLMLDEVETELPTGQHVFAQEGTCG